MVAPEGEGAGVSIARAAEALLRSLVGVSTARVTADSRGRVAGIVVVPASGTAGRQIARNVASALMARFGLVVDPSAIIIGTGDADTSDRSDASTTVAVPAGSPATPHGPGRNGATELSNGNGHDDHGASHGERNGNGVASSPLGRHDETPSRNGRRADPGLSVPRIERVELSPVASGLRCRVTVSVGPDQFVGIGEAACEPMAEVELAARVTVDALRAARVPREPIQFEGATIARVAGHPHAVTALSFWAGTGFERRSGAEPVASSMAEAAARSVVRAVTAHMGEQN